MKNPVVSGIFVVLCLVAVVVHGRPSEPVCTNGAFFPNPDNCAGYLRCEHGRPTAMECALGTWWSQTLSTCVWPYDSNAYCNQINSTTVAPGQTTEPGFTCTNGAFFPNPDNCAGYLRCEHGRLTAMDCAPGTWWSQTLLTCVWPYDSNAYCNQIDSTPVAPGQTTESVCTNGAFFPNPDNCAGYLRCEHGRLTAMNCALGTWWSQTLLTCVWPYDSNAYCNQIDGTTVAPGQTTEPVCTNGAFFPNPDNCAGYLRCEHGRLTAMDCAPGTWWSQTLLTCVWPYDSNAYCNQIDSTPVAPGQTTEPVFICTNGAFFPNPDNCAGYLRCEHGRLTAMHCALGTWWSQTLLTCVWPYDLNAYCNQIDSTPVAPGQTSAVPSICNCTHGDFIPKSNCLGHYRCVWGGLVEMPDCPEGQVWTQTYTTCVQIGSHFDDCVPQDTAAEYQSGCQITTSGSVSVPTTVVTPDPSPVVTPDPTTVVSPDPTTAVTSDPTTAITPNPTTAATTNPTTAVTPNPTAAVTPDPTTAVTPDDNSNDSSDDSSNDSNGDSSNDSSNDSNDDSSNDSSDDSSNDDSSNDISDDSSDDSNDDSSNDSSNDSNDDSSNVSSDESSNDDSSNDDSSDDSSNDSNDDSSNDSSDDSSNDSNDDNSNDNSNDSNDDSSNDNSSNSSDVGDGRSDNDDSSDDKSKDSDDKSRDKDDKSRDRDDKSRDSDDRGKRHRSGKGKGSRG